MTDERDLLGLERSVKRASRGVLILLVLFVLVVGGGGGYAYYLARQRLEPEAMVARAMKQLQNEYPEIRKEVKKKVSAAAPKIAADASRQALKRLPDLRLRLEDFLKREIDTGLNKLTAHGEQELRKFLRAHRDAIRKGFEELRNDPSAGPKFAAAAEQLIGQDLGTDIHQDATKALEEIRRLNDHLARLAKGDNLTPQEQTERHLLRLLRALQVREPGAVPPSGVAKKP